jgi:hypothetical protein
MELAEILMRGAAAGVALYALIHLVWAASSDDYSGLFWSDENRGRSFMAYAHLVLLWFACTTLCISAVYVLFRWMPFDWGTDVEGEFQSYRERFGQLLGVILGLCCLGFLSRSHDRREIAARERQALEASIRKEIADETRSREWAAAAEARKRHEQVDDHEKRAAQLRLEQASAIALRLSLLKAMTSEELDIVWNNRPLISWTEPMHSMTFAEQRQYWAANALHLTDWDIPKDLERRVNARLPKFTS